MNITLEQLSVGYKGFPPVVSNINVEIKSGELTCLIRLKRNWEINIAKNINRISA